MKPVFVSRERRATIEEAVRAAAEEERLEEERRQKEQERRQANRERVVAQVLGEQQQQQAGEGDATDGDGMPDDTDAAVGDEDETEQYEAWKRRELLRVLRERMEEEREERERREVERRRQMTDEEIMREDARIAQETGVDKHGKGRRQRWGFLQRYYHKGAFFRDVDESGRARERILEREYEAAATGQDRFDKSALPKVMQVKNFGRAGRTKYTHLLDQDTTRIGSTSREERMERKMADRRIRERIERRANIMDRPTARQQRRDVGGGSSSGRSGLGRSRSHSHSD